MAWRCLVTAHPDASAALHVAVGLLRFVGGTDADASHIAAAISRHRRDMRIEGSSVPASLDELEKVFARIAIGPQRATRGQERSEIGEPAASVDSEHVPNHLLTRGQAARRLACSITTLKRRERAGDLVPVRDGRLVRYLVADLDAYLDQNRNQAC